MNDVMLQYEVFVIDYNMCNVMRFRSRDGYDISHGIKIERMHDSTRNELHDER